MKRLLILCVLAFLCSTVAGQSDLRKGFQNPPDTAKPEVWWHWTSDDLNKEGITADLESMKKVGIERAHIFFVSGPGEGIGLTPSRLEFYRFAAEEARRLGLTLGMHNCPGWSSSGGPWITPEYSMKGVFATETYVTGGQNVKVKLPQPTTRMNFYRDIAVVAFPVNAGPFEPRMSLDGKAVKGAFTVPVAGKGTKATLECRFDEPVTARTFALAFSVSNVNTGATIEAVDDAGKARQVGSLRMTKHSWSTHIQPNGWQAFRLAEKDGRPVTSKLFRVRFEGQDGELFPVAVSKVRLFDNVMISQIDQKNSATTRIAYYAPEFPGDKGIDPASILDLSDKMSSDGTLDWNAPSGRFTVLRIGYTTTGSMCAPAHRNMRGLECDKLSRAGMDEHWKHMMAPILKQVGPYRSLRASLIDSYEVGGQNWTAGFDRTFEQKRGYSMRPFLPALFGYTVGTADDSAAFLYDFQRTVSDGFAENYYDRFYELCKENGIMSSCEAYGGPFDDLQCSHKIPLAVTEFWMGGGLGSRYSASAARINGRVVNGAESFTASPESGRWLQDPRQLKAVGDTVWLEGVNLFILHSYVNQPYGKVRPGMTLMQYGTHFGRNNTWWSESKGWMDYMARGQFLLQSGRSTAPILILAGESKPNGFGVRRELTRAGFDYDYCDAETVHQRLSAKDGKIHIEGALDYDVFLLGNERNPSLATLRKVVELLEGGARVAGEKPLGSPSLSDRSGRTEYDRIVKTIWEDRKYKTFYATDKPLDALKSAGCVPDFSCGVPTVMALARRTDRERVFFVISTADEATTATASFNAAGMTPEFWDAVSGAVSPVPFWKETADGRIEIPMKFAPHGSMFVVFSKKTSPDHAVAVVEGDVKPERENSLAILEAKYRVRGATDGGVDVLARVQNAMTAQGLAITVENGQLGKRDPYPNQVKELFLRYRFNDTEVAKAYTEHQYICLSLFPKDEYIADCVAGTDSLSAEFTKPGRYAVRLASGKTVGAICERKPTTLSLNRDWTVEFERELGAPTGAIPFDSLISWTKRPEFGIKYFSGAAVYRKTVTIPPEEFRGQKRYRLDLGEVKNLARVTVNGHDLGTLWTPPFALDITSAVKPGANTFEIKVVNLWVNRMIGDEFHPTAGDKEKPDWVMKGFPNSGDGRYTWSSWKGWTKEDTPLVSGLLGPVTLQIRPVLPLE